MSSAQHRHPPPAPHSSIKRSTSCVGSLSTAFMTDRTGMR